MWNGTGLNFGPQSQEPKIPNNKNNNDNDNIYQTQRQNKEPRRQPESLSERYRPVFQEVLGSCWTLILSKQLIKKKKKGIFKTQRYEMV